MPAVVSLVRLEDCPGTPASQDRAHFEPVYAAVRDAVERLGGIGKFVKPGDRVLVKPNAVWPVSADAGITTDPRVVEAVIRLIMEEANPREVILAERTGVGRKTMDALVATGIKDAAERARVSRIIPLEFEPRISVAIPGAKALISPIQLPKALFDVDSIVYIPKMKTHKQAVVSLTMKLSQGMLTFSDMIRCHRADIEQKFVDLLRVIRPNLSVIDAIWAMEGQGPGSPYPQDLMKDRNLIIAGADPVAVDAVAAATMGFDPLSELGMIRGAALEGLGEGDIEHIEVRGARVEDVKRYFRRGTCSLVGLHPKIDVYAGGACIGCAGFTRTGLDPLLAQPELLDSVEKITVVLGYNTEVPERLEHDPPRSYVFVAGDCAAEHRDRGIFFPGCASTSVHEIIDFLGKDEKEVERVYWKYQPRGWTP